MTVYARKMRRSIVGNPGPELLLDIDDVNALSAMETAKSLSLAVLYTYGADVEGDIAEFGTMSGSTAQALATAMLAAERWVGPSFKRLHLFDSFEGFPEINAQVDMSSPHVQKGVWARGTCKFLSFEELKRVVERVLPARRVEMHEGWFADTVNVLPNNTRFSLIHFDGDLYQSMIDALDPCFAKGFVSEGAMICFDDWNCNRASNKYGERRAWEELVSKYKIQFSMSGDYSWGCTKVIVHAYSSAIGSSS
ncbi:MAG: TylF/MycF/NovP-related O-methyltransferase [Rhizomicrobium sp.]